jgi:hypothetical protein
MAVFAQVKAKREDLTRYSPFGSWFCGRPGGTDCTFLTTRVDRVG